MDKVWIKLCLLLPVKCDSINNVFFLRISGFVQRPFNWFMMMCPVEPSRALLRGDHSPHRVSIVAALRQSRRRLGCTKPKLLGIFDNNSTYALVAAHL